MHSPATSPEHVSGLRSGAEVADILAPAFAAARPAEAALLLAPATVLTAAGLKGLSYIPDVGDMDEDALGRLNMRRRDPLLRFGWEAGNGGMFVIQNLAGAERSSRRSKLPGILRFESRLGYEAYLAYREQQRASFAREIANGSYPYNTSAAELDYGVAYGYPDRAIIDLERVVTTQNRDLIFAMQLTDIEGNRNETGLDFRRISTYDESGVDFWLRADHMADPGVSAYIEAARWVLREFTETPIAKRLKGDLAVQIAVEERATAQAVRRQLEHVLGSFTDLDLFSQ